MACPCQQCAADHPTQACNIDGEGREVPPRSLPGCHCNGDLCTKLSLSIEDGNEEGR